MLNNIQYGAETEMQKEQLGQFPSEVTNTYRASKDSIEANEQKLVADAQGGCLSAFERLIARYEPTVFRLARRIGQSREDAEEITQNAFVQAFRNLPRFRGDSRFATWLGRITINEGLMKVRRRQLEVISLDDPVGFDERVLPRDIEDRRLNPEQLCSQKQLQSVLTQTIARLSPTYRMAVQLHYVQDFSIEETAEALHLSVAAVKSRISRARVQLRLWLNRYVGLLSSPGSVMRRRRKGQ